MQHSFHYIIIGAGSAGCVLANRLSANPAVSVLLIEAGGPDRDPRIHLPAGYTMLHRTKVDWGFWSAPQEQLLNRKLYLPRGKVLGGSSSTNAMVYVRGNAKDYNDWAALGNRSWAYDDVLPYFIKSEHHADIQDSFHGTTGELNVEWNKTFVSPFRQAFLAACQQSGFQYNNDYNGAQQAGVGLAQFTTKNGQRHSGASAFLHPVLQRPNLTVLTHTRTTEVLLKNDQATGVATLNRKNRRTDFHASTSVILSAGAFGSPQLLMLSGIGDRAELGKHGIQCKHPLPGVGKNLQDHLFVPVGALAHQQLGQNHYHRPWHKLNALWEYYTRKTGAFTSGPLEAMAFGSSSLSPGRVDYQFQYSSMQAGSDYSVDFHDVNTFPKTDGFSILPTLLRPQSVGNITLKSGNPQEQPIIQPNFFAQENDRQVMIQACKKAVEVIEAAAYDPYRKNMLTIDSNSSDDEIWHHIQRQVETVYHPVGTCKMGSDEMAVVDDQLRVHGIGKLSVIDASIMPTIVSGNTNAPVYMIAEKGADFLTSSHHHPLLSL